MSAKPGSIKGVVAHIKWVYYSCAQLENYTVTRTPENKWTLSAAVVLSDAFKMSQKPLLFVAPHAKGAWQWPIHSHEITNGVITAKLGNPETITT